MRSQPRAWRDPGPFCCPSGSPGLPSWEAVTRINTPSIQDAESETTGGSNASPSPPGPMKRLPTLRAATVAAIVGGTAISLAPAMAIPISGVKPSIARRADTGTPAQGPYNRTAGVSSGTSVAKGRPMAFPAPIPTDPSDWLLGMKR